MSIDIATYRSRIGSFKTPCQKRFKCITPHYSQDSSKPKWKSIVFLLINVFLVSAVVKLNSTKLKLLWSNRNKNLHLLRE